MNMEQVIKFAKQNGYEGVDYEFEWKGYDIYSLVYSYTEMCCIGIPTYILVKDNEIRMATPQENKEIFEESLKII